MKSRLLPPRLILYLLMAILFSCQQRPAENPGSGESSTTSDIGEEEPAMSEEPALQIKDFIPPQWKTIRKVTGDLNKDGLADVALVIQGTDRRKIHYDPDYQENVDENPRSLLLLFADPNSGGYELGIQKDNFIPIKELHHMEDPFGEMTIKKGVLKIKTGAMLSAGSWTNYFTDYVFRYQDGYFALIGFDQSEFNRSSGEFTRTSVNLLTGDYFVETSNETEEYNTPRKVRGKLRNTALPDLDTFSPGDEYEFIKSIPM